MARRGGAPSDGDPVGAMLAERIRTARAATGISVSELARRLNVSRVRVSEWENKKGQPDVGNLRRLALTLGVSVDFLLGVDLVVGPSSAPLNGAGSAAPSRATTEQDATPPADRDARLQALEERVDLLTRALRRGLGAALDAAEVEQAERGRQAPHTDSAT
jgi:transcriptional regulator with XRE-family HTH domain